MWKCEACGTQGIAGDLTACPGCGVARTAGADDASVQVPADAFTDVEAAPTAPSTATAPATPEPLADHTAETPEASHADTAEAPAPSIPDSAVPDGT